MKTGTDEVVLVNESDEVLGTMEKLLAHQKGVLHRAFSVLIFNDNDEMLIHKRAADKYHCGGLWTNACCSHPRLNESPLDGAIRRLNEEMGFSCDLNYVDAFIYKVNFDNGLTEHEFDHLFVGRYNGTPIINPAEVSDWKFIGLDELKEEIRTSPEDFTFWFKEIADKRLNKIDFTSI